MKTRGLKKGTVLSRHPTADFVPSFQPYHLPLDQNIWCGFVPPQNRELDQGMALKILKCKYERSHSVGIAHSQGDDLVGKTKIDGALDYSLGILVPGQVRCFG